MPSPTPRSTVGALLAASVLAVCTTAPAEAAMPSTSGIGPRAGVVVVDLDTGRTLLSRAGSTRRIPASVNKLFTIGTALRLLGPDWAPRTRVVATGQAVGRTWQGDLYLVGGGDPTLTRAGVAGLAAQAVRELGASRLDGRVEVDASAFDDWQGGARTGRAPDGDLGGRLGALTVDRGAQTTDPASRAGSLFRTALRTAGLAVTGTVGATPAPAGATTVAVLQGPTLAQLAASTLGPSDNFYAETIEKDLASRDGVASACRVRAGLTPLAPDPALSETPADTSCRTAGAATPPATTSAGALVVRTTLRPLVGTAPHVIDGSGLSRQDRVSPTVVVRLLRALDADPTVSPVLRAALPQAGRTGTLANRMRGTPAVGRCAAKTGTINGVSTLAGYCRTKPGRNVAFAILQNGTSTWAAHAFQDRFVARLAARG